MTRRPPGSPRTDTLFPYPTPSDLHLRRNWPDTHITIRGDGHYGRPEVMAYCDAARVDYVFGLPTNSALRADPAIVAVADACAVKRAQRQCPVLRNYAETRYGAKTWKCQRRVVARIEASKLGKIGRAHV